MQPPGGPPGDKRRPLPPPWGHPPREPTATPTPTPTPASAPGRTTQPGPAPAPPAVAPQPVPVQVQVPQALPQPMPMPTPMQTLPMPQPTPMPMPTPMPLPLVAPPPAEWSSQELPESKGLVEFLQISARRSFRIRIDPEEVLPQERAALTLLEPPIADPALQAYVAWRRSVLFVIVCALVPLVLFRVIELASYGDEYPAGYIGMQTIPLLAEAAFLAIAWVQLTRWTAWQAQRRPLTLAWLAFFLAPFVIYLYPMQRLFGAGDLLGVGVVVSIQAIVVLAPRAVSPTHGLIRAALVGKLLHPSAAAPGWLIALAAPVHALVAFVALILPYQITGSGWFVAGILGVVAAQYFIGRAGLRLVEPQPAEQVLDTLRRARTGYLIAMGLGALFVVIGFASVADTMDLPALRIVNLVLALGVSVFAVTLICSDYLLDKLRSPA